MDDIEHAKDLVLLVQAKQEIERATQILNDLALHLNDTYGREWLTILERDNVDLWKRLADYQWDHWWGEKRPR